MSSFGVHAIGVVESPLTDLDAAPRQPDEGAILDLKPVLSGRIGER